MEESVPGRKRPNAVTFFISANNCIKENIELENLEIKETMKMLLDKCCALVSSCQKQENEYQFAEQTNRNALHPIPVRQDVFEGNDFSCEMPFETVQIYHYIEGIIDDVLNNIDLNSYKNENLSVKCETYKCENCVSCTIDNDIDVDTLKDNNVQVVQRNVDMLMTHEITLTKRDDKLMREMEDSQIKIEKPEFPEKAADTSENTICESPLLADEYHSSGHCFKDNTEILVSSYDKNDGQKPNDYCTLDETIRVVLGKIILGKNEKLEQMGKDLHDTQTIEEQLKKYNEIANSQMNSIKNSGTDLEYEFNKDVHINKNYGKLSKEMMETSLNGKDNVHSDKKEATGVVTNVFGDSTPSHDHQNLNSYCKYNAEMNILPCDETQYNNHIDKFELDDYSHENPVHIVSDNRKFEQFEKYSETNTDETCADEASFQYQKNTEHYVNHIEELDDLQKPGVENMDIHRPTDKELEDDDNVHVHLLDEFKSFDIPDKFIGTTETCGITDRYNCNEMLVNSEGTQECGNVDLDIENSNSINSQGFDLKLNTCSDFEDEAPVNQEQETECCKFISALERPSEKIDYDILENKNDVVRELNSDLIYDKKTQHDEYKGGSSDCYEDGRYQGTGSVFDMDQAVPLANIDTICGGQELDLESLYCNNYVATDENAARKTSPLKSCFKWKYAPSCDVDEMFPSNIKSEDEKPIHILSLPQCRKPLRLGLSKKQQIKSLHPSLKSDRY